MRARRQLTQAERSDFIYSRMLDPVPAPSFAAVRDANGSKARTADEHEQIEARKTTVPAPRSRRRGPRGSAPKLEREDDES